jgi:hypothetical protein
MKKLIIYSFFIINCMMLKSVPRAYWVLKYELSLEKN